MTTRPFRITPSLGPDLTQHSTTRYWDGVTDIAGTGTPSFSPGTKVVGTDGHVYVYVKAAANLAAGTDVTVNETTWVATAGAGTYEATVAVLANEWFFARMIAL